MTAFLQLTYLKGEGVQRRGVTGFHFIGGWRMTGSVSEAMDVSSPIYPPNGRGSVGGVVATLDGTGGLVDFCWTRRRISGFVPPENEE